MVIYILCIIICILLITLFWILKRDSYAKHLESFIEFNNHITVLTTQKEIIAVNAVGLQFFKYGSTKALKKEHKYLCKIFDEVTTEDTKFVEGMHWVTKIHKHQHIKVQMYSEGLKQIFMMSVSKIQDEIYQVSFYNISRVIAEKEAITKLAHRDTLTQIYNRSKLNILLSTTLRNAYVYNEPFTIILFDIDYFKKINDMYGHNVGDMVLIQLASLVKSQLRSNDTFARWGGEEFIILSEGSVGKDATYLASRLRQTIEAFAFDEIDGITCSFGVSQYQSGDTETTLLKRADDALYKAKENGRNKVYM